MIFGYLFKRLRRHVSEAFLSALIVAVIVLLLLGLHHYYSAQQAKLDAAYENYDIRCTVTNISGSRQTDLNITAGYLGLFEEGGELSLYTEDVFLLRQLNDAVLRRSANADPTTGKTVRLYMTNDPQRSAYLEGAVIRYEEDYDSKSFRGEESICIVSERLSMQIGTDSTVFLHTPMGETEARVVGTYLDEEDTVFVAWQPMAVQLKANGISAAASSMSFSVSDNRQLGEVKTILRDYFIPASRTNKSSNMHGLIIDDGLFIDTVVVLERSLALMRVVRLVVYVLSVGISFLVAFLGIRSRRLELAVMRSMGTRSIALYIEVLCEHILFFMLGASVACLITIPFGMPHTESNLATVGLFMICYLIGVALAVAQATSGQIMQTLKGKE